MLTQEILGADLLATLRQAAVRLSRASPLETERVDSAAYVTSPRS